PAKSFSVSVADNPKLRWGANRNDYENVGKTNVALYRPSTAQWFVRTSSGGFLVDPATNLAPKFGAINTDVPIPADYDGDGKADFAVYRKSTAQWLMTPSNPSPTNLPRVVAIGNANQDEPVAADYDGDGKVDMAVYRRSTSSWLIIQSTQGV